MFCEDILYIIASFLNKLRDVISLHNTCKICRTCKFNITLQTKKIVPNFIYDDYNITKICSIFSDYSDIDKLLTDSLTNLSISHRINNINIFKKVSELTSLTKLQLSNNKYVNDSTFKKLVNLKYLNIGLYPNNYILGSFLTNFDKITFLNLGETFILSKYINKLITLEHLFINIEIQPDDFNTLINLKTLDVSKSDYTLSDSNIQNLYKLVSLKCKFSTISNVSHLQHLEMLYLGLNFKMDTIENLEKLKILSIINTNIGYINVPNLMELLCNDVIDDNSLYNLSSLTYLYLSDNLLITDKGIKHLSNLEFLHCGINKNISSDSIGNCINLKYLHAGMSYVDLNNLSHLHNLRYLEQYDSYLGNLESVILLDNR